MSATFGEVAVANLGISSDIALAQSDDGLTAARLVFSPWDCMACGGLD